METAFTYYKDRSISENLRDTIRFIRLHWDTLKVPMLSIILFTHVVGTLLQFTFLNLAIQHESIGSALFINVVNIVTAMLVFIGLSNLLAAHLYNRPKDENVFVIMTKGFWNVLAYGALLFLIFVVSFAFFIFPFTIAFFFLLLTIPIVLLEKNGSSPLKRSFSLVKGNWWYVFFSFVLIASFITLAQTFLSLPFYLVVWLLGYDLNQIIAFGESGSMGDPGFFLAMLFLSLPASFMNSMYPIGIGFLLLSLKERKERISLTEELNQVLTPKTADQNSAYNSNTGSAQF
ncbi:MAG: hypothetical protein LAT67_02725 [Balneolales bacterium]|nr:hypothetical protein [Balneolales bacterium]